MELKINTSIYPKICIEGAIEAFSDLAKVTICKEDNCYCYLEVKDIEKEFEKNFSSEFMNYLLEFLAQDTFVL